MKPEVIERLMALAAGIPVDMNEMASAKTIAAADPPQHTRMRRIVSRGFTPPRGSRRWPPPSAQSSTAV